MKRKVLLCGIIFAIICALVLGIPFCAEEKTSPSFSRICSDRFFIRMNYGEALTADAEIFTENNIEILSVEYAYYPVFNVYLVVLKTDDLDNVIRAVRLLNTKDEVRYAQFYHNEYPLPIDCEIPEYLPGYINIKFKKGCTQDSLPASIMENIEYIFPGSHLCSTVPADWESIIMKKDCKIPTFTMINNLLQTGIISMAEPKYGSYLSVGDNSDTLGSFIGGRMRLSTNCFVVKFKDKSTPAHEESTFQRDMGITAGYYKIPGADNINVIGIRPESKTDLCSFIKLAQSLDYVEYADYNISSLLSGDIDDNRELELSDAMAIFFFVAGKDNLNKFQKYIADINFDREVDITDAIAVFNKIAGR